MGLDPFNYSGSQCRACDDNDDIHGRRFGSDWRKPYGLNSRHGKKIRFESFKASRTIGVFYPDQNCMLAFGGGRRWPKLPTRLGQHGGQKGQAYQGNHRQVPHLQGQTGPESQLAAIIGRSGLDICGLLSHL